MGLLENFKDKGQCDQYLPKILTIVQDLLKESEGADSLRSMVLQVIAIMLWYNPVTTVKMLNQKNYLEELL